MVGLCSFVRFSVHRLFSLPELHVHLAHVGHGGIQGICQGGVHILLALHGAEHHGVVCLKVCHNLKFEDILSYSHIHTSGSSKF